MSSNYREYEYDVHSPQLSMQIQEDIKESKEIEKRAEEIRDEKGEEIAKKELHKDEVSPEEIEEVLSDYASKEYEYLVDGALLKCDRAKRGAIDVDLGTTIVRFEGNNCEDYKYTRLHVKENAQNDNELYAATVGDTIHGEEEGNNIHPFRCNCEILPDREWEIEKIKKNIAECKKYGTCSQLMNLNDEWDNIPSQVKYFTYTDVNKDGCEEKERINMMSMLFCKHGGLITPVRSGQSKKRITGKFVGYLAYGCKSITQNPEEGYYMLYDGPTVDGEGEVHMFADIYDACGRTPSSALQGYGGKAGLNTLEDSLHPIRYEDQDNYNSSNGVLCHNGIYRHAIAIGPMLQNPNFTIDETIGLKGEEMIYGTCVDVIIEFEGSEYYIPATIVDSKGHSAPEGYVQTGLSFSGEYKECDKGNIVEWYVVQKENGKNKSLGLKQFNENGAIVIYRDEVALEKEDE